MFGAVAKTYYAQKMGLDPKDIVVVAVMPCVAKKFEAGRDNQAAAGVPDVDVAITTREFARMIEKAGIKFDRLPDEEFDRVMGEASGAGHIFGASGGVMEAALRTAAEVLTGKELEKPEFMEVRGTDKGIKEAVYTLAGKTIRVAAVSGLANAPIRYIVDDCKKFVEREIRRGNHYDGIIMDPPSYGRGPGGEVWKLEESINELITLTAQLLSDEPLFFLVNSYTTGLSPLTMSYLLELKVRARYGGVIESGELGLKVTQTGAFLPCGASSRWYFK